MYLRGLLLRGGRGTSGEERGQGKGEGKGREEGEGRGGEGRKEEGPGPQIFRPRTAAAFVLQAR